MDVSPPDIFGPGRFDPAFLDQDVSPLDILDLDVLPPSFLDQDVSPPDFLDMDVLLPDVSDQEVSPPNILDQDIPPSDNCFIIQNIGISWKLCHLGEFTSNFSWRCFTIHVALWSYVRDYATLLEVALTSMRH